VFHRAEVGDLWAQVRFFSLTQIYWGDTALGGLVQAWTLATEVSFYLFLPVWAALLARVGGPLARRVRVHYAGLAVLVVGGLTFRGLLRGGGHAIGYAWLPANIDLFALGMALAVLSAARAAGHRMPTLLETLGERPWIAWLAALCCYGAIVSLRYPYGFALPTVSQEVAREALLGAVAILVVVPGVVGDQGQGVGRRILASRPLHAIGLVSYGIYLWHLTVMAEVFDRWPGPLLAAGTRPLWSWARLAIGTAVISTAVAAVSWFVLEAPLLRVVRRRDQPGSSPAHEAEPRSLML